MNITAIAQQDLESKGLDLLPNKIELEIKGDIFPDTYGEWIGRYDKTNNCFESFFKKDIELGNTERFDKHKENCNLYEKHRHVFDRESLSEKEVIDYYVMYNIQESSKFKPTIISEHVDHSFCINGSFKCEYELLFTCNEATRRIIIPFNSVNVPMYEFIRDLEDMVDDILNFENDESNLFNNIIQDCGGYHEFRMFDEIGNNYDVEVEDAADFMAMLVSVRLVGYKFVENKEKD